MSSDDDKDMYEDGSDSALSSLSSDSEFGAKRPAKAAQQGCKRQKRSGPRPERAHRTGRKEDEQAGKRLSKKAVALQAASGTISCPADRRTACGISGRCSNPRRPGRGSHILGRDEVKKWVRDLGEMWTDDEVSLGLSGASAHTGLRSSS